MLEIFEQNPQSRVFHVDRECYVVYLGSHWEDYKPFLRLGTSTSLPPGLPPIVSTIVVPDALTGNPLDEPACLSGDATPDTHYVGDVETVEHMKSFVGQHTIPVEAIEVVDREEDDGKHVVVYYYRDGNLKIKFRKNEIFDLRRREKLDGHFIARAQDAKNEYGRSPFKLPGDSYQRPGFLVVEGTPYLVARGELAALRLTDDYFFELSSAGIDADRISTVQTEDADRALIRFFKRSRTKNRPIRVATPREKRIEEAADLFPANSLPELSAKVIEGHGGAFDFHRFSVTQAPGRFEAVLEELGGPIVFGSIARKRSDAPVTVDAAAGTINFAGGRGSAPLVEGVLYQIAGDRITRSVIEESFLPEKNYAYRDLLSQAENTLIGQLQYFFAELFGGRDTGKVIRTLKGLDPIRAIGKADGSIHPVLQVLLHNYRQYVEFVRTHEPEAANGADALASLLERHQLTRADVPPILPLIGEIYRDGDRVFLFYRFVARITSDRYAHAERIVERIRSIPPADFESERSRLADLIAGLATPEQMDEARMRRIAEATQQKRRKSAANAAAAPAGPAEGQGEDAGPHDSADAAAASGRRGAVARDAGARRATGRSGSGSRSTRGQRSGGRWILPVAALLLLIAALLALLLTGTIPSPWIGDETRIVTDDEQPVGPGDDRPAGDRDGPEDGEGVADPGRTDPQTVDRVPGTDTADPDAVGPSDAGDAAGDAADEGQPGETTPDRRLPEGWPPDALPAIRALEDTPGVTITRTRVIGPGGIEITLLDIIVLVNRIATDNGYARMDEIDASKPDPDWIYPGNVFVLPNGTRYTVVGGDTLWEITVRYMVARLRQDFERYTQLVSEYQAETADEGRRAEIVRMLRSIAGLSHTERFSQMVEEVLDRWEE